MQFLIQMLSGKVGECRKEVALGGLEAHHGTNIFHSVVHLRNVLFQSIFSLIHLNLNPSQFHPL